MSTAPQPIVFLIWDIHFHLLTFSVSLFLFRKGHLAVVRFLVDGGHCQPNSKDSGGRTALHWAAWYVLLQIIMCNSSIVVYCLKS